MIRIVTGGIAQETNTFQWEPTTLADFTRVRAPSCAARRSCALDGTGTDLRRHRRRRRSGSGSS